jgi:hypothetical protein
MSASMVSHVAHALELLSADLAEVRSFAAVSAHVDLEVPLLEEGLLTYRA